MAVPVPTPEMLLDEAMYSPEYNSLLQQCVEALRHSPLWRVCVGTCGRNSAIVQAVVRTLRRQGWKVTIAADSENYRDYLYFSYPR